MAIWQDLVDDHGFTARYANAAFPRDAAEDIDARGPRRHHHGAR
jgi:hypothetical protein